MLCSAGARRNLAHEPNKWLKMAQGNEGRHRRWRGTSQGISAEMRPVGLSESHHPFAALMGHSNLNTTSIYTIPSALDLEHAVAQIDE